MLANKESDRDGQDSIHNMNKFIGYLYIKLEFKTAESRELESTVLPLCRLYVAV